MKYTNNYNLKKPDPEDFYSVNDMNTNTDIIDSELQKINNAVNVCAKGEGIELSVVNGVLCATYDDGL